MRCRQGKEESIPPTPSKPMLRKSLWSPEEDNKLTNYIMKNGLLRCWNYVANEADIQRSGKSCRLRWINYLRPDLNRGAFSYKEELLIIHLQSFLGNRWSLIAAQLPGRTDNDVKNYWNTCIKKRLKLKHHLSSSTNTKSIIPSQYPNTKSVPAHEPHDAFTTGQNQFCVPDQLELSHGQVQDQSDHEFSIDPNPTHIQQLSYSQPWINASSVHPHKSFASHPAFTAPSLQASKSAKSSTCDQLIIEPCRRTTVLPDEAPHSAYYSPGSTGITIPALLESEWLKEKDENDENHMMNDYSNAWTAGHSYLNAAEYSHVVDPGAYTARDTGISIMDDSDSLYNGTLMGFISQVDSQSFT